MKSARFLFAVVLLFVALSTSWGQPPAPKKRVAVTDFDYGAVHQWWEGTWDIGKGISDVIVDQLQKESSYQVLERRNLDKILAEQNLSTSQRADAGATIKTGKILAVNVLIVGSVTQFGTEKKETKVGGVFSRVPVIGGLVAGKEKGIAKVMITARGIHPVTSEILFSVSGEGKSSRSGFLLAGLGGGGGTLAGGGISMTSSDFQQTILGEATLGAVNQIVQGLKEMDAKIPVFKNEIRGVVADVSGSRLIVNVGSTSGVQVGDLLDILTVGRVIKDPISGETLRQETIRIGRLQITEVDEKSAAGLVAELVPSASVQIGDLVRKP